MLQRSNHILSNADPVVSDIMRKQLSSFGVEILSNTEVSKASVGGGKVSLSLMDKSTQSTSQREFEKVLVATGRVPNYDGLGIENTRVQRDESNYIRIDEKCQTADPFIMAIGDITGPPLLAHRAFYMGKVAAEVCAGLPSAYDAQVVPSVVYSDPEIAYVGLQEMDAQKQGRQIITGTFPFSASGRALGANRAVGFVKLIADPASHVVLGALLVGSRVSEMISEIAFAVETASRLEDLAGTIHPHPTFSEAIAEAAENALKKGVHT
jgi:dihydrolipoamide dehydrogenase